MNIKRKMLEYKWDICIIISFLIIALSGYIFFQTHSDSFINSSKIIALVDGEVINSFDFGEEGDYVIDTEYGVNVIRIDNKIARVINADCPNKECMNMSLLSDGSNSIICIPNHLVLKIVGNMEGSYDAIAY